MNGPRLILGLLLLPSLGLLAQDCTPMPNPPKLPVVRENAQHVTSTLKTRMSGTLFDTWKPARKPIATFGADTEVSVVESISVVESPAILRASKQIPQLKTEAGDQLLRYSRFPEGFADLWINGCWYKHVDASFVIEPNGEGCSHADCAAKVTKPGRETLWFRVKLPNGKTGWTVGEMLDRSAGA